MATRWIGGTGGPRLSYGPGIGRSRRAPEAGSRWALHELRSRIKAGDLAGARAAAESLAPFWKRTGSQAGLLGAAVDVAAGLGVAGTAAMLLELAKRPRDQRRQMVALAKRAAVIR
jgi:hypothetical protein